MKQNKNGFTLAETIIGIGLLAVVLTGIMAFQIQLSKSSANETLASTLAVKRTELVGAITGDAAWQKTVASNAAAHLDCIGSTAGCTAFTGTYSFSVYDADNNTLFNPAVNTGFNRDGKPCTGTPCDAPFQIQWKAACGASDPNCAHPLIQITGTFATSTATASMDLKNIVFKLIARLLRPQFARRRALPARDNLRFVFHRDGRAFRPILHIVAALQVGSTP